MYIIVLNAAQIGPETFLDKRLRSRVFGRVWKIIRGEIRSISATVSRRVRALPTAFDTAPYCARLSATVFSQIVSSHRRHGRYGQPQQQAATKAQWPSGMPAGGAREETRETSLRFCQTPMHTHEKLAAVNEHDQSVNTLAGSRKWRSHFAPTSKQTILVRSRRISRLPARAIGPHASRPLSTCASARSAKRAGVASIRLSLPVSLKT